MKKILLLLALVCHFIGFSQKQYFSGFHNWFVNGFNSSGNAAWLFYYFEVGTVDVGNGYLYRNIEEVYGSSAGGGGGLLGFLLREDTLGGIVYFRDYDSFGNDTDRILYKYNVHVGDTIHSHDSFFPLTVIDSVCMVDSLLINGVYHKKITLKKILDPYSANFGADSITTYIEGFGSIADPMGRQSSLDFQTRTKVRCVLDSGGFAPVINTSYPFPSLNDSGWFVNDCAYLGAAAVPQQVVQTTIIPNPVYGEARIVFPAAIASGALHIFNAVGQAVQQILFQSKTELPFSMGNLPAGSYYYKVYDYEKGSIFSGRIMKE